MKKNLSVIIGLIAVLIFSVCYGFTNRTHKIYDNNVNTAQYSAIGIVQEGGSVSQSFTCEENELDGFYIKCDPSGEADDIVITVTVTDPETGDILSVGSDTGNNIKARKLHKFIIDPIIGYKGKALRLTVTETGSTASDGIILYYQPSDASIGNFSIDENITTGVFVMKTLTECFDFETFIIVFLSVMFIWGFMYFLYRLFK